MKKFLLWDLLTYSLIFIVTWKIRIIPTLSLRQPRSKNKEFSRVSPTILQYQIIDFDKYKQKARGDVQTTKNWKIYYQTSSTQPPTRRPKKVVLHLKDKKSVQDFKNVKNEYGTLSNFTILETSIVEVNAPRICSPSIVQIS